MRGFFSPKEELCSSVALHCCSILPPLLPEPANLGSTVAPLGSVSFSSAYSIFTFLGIHHILSAATVLRHH